MSNTSFKTIKICLYSIYQSRKKPSKSTLCIFIYLFCVGGIKEHTAPRPSSAVWEIQSSLFLIQHCWHSTPAHLYTEKS